MSEMSNRNDDLFRFIDNDSIQSEKIIAPRYSYWASVFRVFFRKRINIVLIVIFALILLSSFIVPVFCPYDPYENIMDATTFNLSLAGARALQMDGPVLNVPTRRRLVHAVASPALQCLSVEEGDISVFVYSEILEVHLSLVDNFKVESGSGRRVFRAFASRTVAVALTFVIAA